MCLLICVVVFSRALFGGFVVCAVSLLFLSVCVGHYVFVVAVAFAS